MVSHIASPAPNKDADHRVKIVQALMSWQGDGVLMAREAGKQVIMDEFNSASCGGEAGRSDTVSHFTPPIARVFPSFRAG